MKNWLSLFGSIVAAASFFAVLCLMAMDFFAGFANPYMGVLTYLISPGFLVLGLFLILVGVALERRRRRRLAPGEVPQFPHIDLNVPSQRRAFIAVVAGAFVFLLLTAVGSYRTYQFTESVTFCGRLCHGVMKPEYTAYLNSPHARVTCTECHIGPGATWFVRSKLSGVYQVYATIMNKYPRPIPTPIKDLRPAQETCEQCHWPQKFFGAVERVRTHFLSDEKNSPWTIQMLLKVGGGDPAHGPVGGIHWHMSVANKVEYIAADEARQVIPWVRITSPAGGVTVYESTDNRLTAEQIAKRPIRRLDCIDCHNRPTHIFRSPNESLDTALLLGRIDPAIPFIKKNAAAALTGDYASEAEALTKIAEKLKADCAGYKDQAKVEAAIAQVQKICQQNFFPSMKTTWRSHPDNIGHLNWPGCARCHDGKHTNAAGKTITDDCHTCHDILAQGPGTSLQVLNAKGLEFQHPSQELPPGTQCTDCHTGGPQE
jgi:nitrate/TMAO reductase-like tetraheme cytochrome c subunit